MVYLSIFISAIILLLVYMRIEAGMVEIKRIKFTENKKCLKILHMSDIHINRLKVPWHRVKNAINEERPDIVLFTGDYIESERDIPRFLEFLKYVDGNSKILFCLGNHDYNAFSGNREGLKGFISAIEGAGASFLHNQSICIEKGHTRYNVAGFDDLKAGNPDIKKTFDSCCDKAYMTIAFSHNPDIIFEIPKGKVDYLFCGHFHGGQIWLPFNLEFKLMRIDRLSKMGIRKGLHKINGTNVYINRGLGNVCLPLRFLSRPEISIYHLP